MRGIFSAGQVLLRRRSRHDPRQRDAGSRLSVRGVQAIAGAVAALAALVTLIFAWLTVRGAQALDLAADLDEAERKAMTSHAPEERGAWRDARTARLRFRAAIDATGEQLPACRARLDLDRSPLTMAEHRIDEADQALAAALDELSARLGD